MRTTRPALATATTVLLGLSLLGMSTTAHATDNNDGCTITTITNGSNNHITNACGRITYGNNAVNGTGHTVTTGLGQLGATGLGAVQDIKSYFICNNSSRSLTLNTWTMQTIRPLPAFTLRANQQPNDCQEVGLIGGANEITAGSVLMNISGGGTIAVDLFEDNGGFPDMHCSVQNSNIALHCDFNGSVGNPTLVVQNPSVP